MRRFVATALIACLIAGYVTATPAATAPADAIKYRKAVMDALAAHVGAFVMVNMGKVDHPDHLKAHITAVADLGAQVKDLFPVGSDTGKTDALPLIWKEQTQFNEGVTKLEKSTAQLRDAVAANDKAGTTAAFKAVGEACKGCHDRYRKKDE